MGRTKIAGLYKRQGVYHIDKDIRGYGRLCESCGTSEIEEAERYLIHRLNEIRQASRYGVRPKRTFRKAATEYLTVNKNKATIETDALHLKQLDSYIGELLLEHIHDGTLKCFVDARKAAGIKDSSINRALEVVRHILNLAARSWRDELGLTWLASAPLIKMLQVTDARPAYPISWDEQDFLLQALPAHLQRMVLFKVNSGTREAEVCGLRWDWEVSVPELDTSVFLIPGPKVKNREDRLVVLNDVAKSVIESCRGHHRVNVFAWRINEEWKYKPTKSMNNSAWERARADAVVAYEEKFSEAAPEGFARLRVHDLKHTFGRRLRSARVPLETRKVLLGHKNGDITTHYSAPELSELIEAANKVCLRPGKSAPQLTLLKRKVD